ncbi:MAG: 2Fe-2S iron-sulfur cluster-binding protein, partial [Saprospiraceae bacterium]|nr:2Fe-2S iron-sulfur cluster-binding protein [Saprospiraceae bacterium]
LCGPQSMMEEVSTYLEANGVGQEKIKTELFTSPEMLDRHKQTNQTGRQSVEIKGTLRVKHDGQLNHFPYINDQESILDIALQHGADLPFACKGGVCCTCKARLLEGKVDMRVNYGLNQAELKQDYILTCQSYPRTNQVLVDYDVI